MTQKSGYQRELRYATNMESPFVDEQKGEATLGRRIVFRNGNIAYEFQKKIKVSSKTTYLYIILLMASIV